MLTITTAESVTYRIEYRDLEGRGRRLAMLRERGTDDDDVLDDSYIEPERWYQVNVLDPMPPRAGESMTLVLDSNSDANAPVVRRTTMVTSVVGTI